MIVNIGSARWMKQKDVYVVLYAIKSAFSTPLCPWLYRFVNPFSLLPFFYTLSSARTQHNSLFRMLFTFALFRFFNLPVFHYEMDIKSFVNELWRIWWSEWMDGEEVVYITGQRVISVIHINFCKRNEFQEVFNEKELFFLNLMNIVIFCFYFLIEINEFKWKYCKLLLILFHYVFHVLIGRLEFLFWFRIFFVLLLSICG